MENYNKIIQTFQDKGFKAYYSGDSARQIYMKEPLNSQEIFIATDARLSDIRKIFKNQFNMSCDVYDKANRMTTELCADNIRIHPFIRTTLSNGFASRSYTNNIKEDAYSQSLTIYSLYYDPIQKKFFDYTDARKDIDNKSLRFVGDPYKKISEDRLVMFDLGYALANLGSEWDVEYETFKKTKLRGLEITVVSPKVIQREFTRLMTQTQKPSLAFRFFLNTGILQEFIPQIRHTKGLSQSNKARDLDLFNHIMYALDSVPTSQDNCEIIRWAAIFHDLSKPYTINYDDKGEMHFYGHDKIGAIFARRFFERYRFPVQLSKDVYIICKHHLFDANPNLDREGVRRLINRVGKRNIINVIDMRVADRFGTGRDDISMKKIEKLRTKIKKEL